MTTAQRVLFAMAGAIFIAVFVYSLASGEFAEKSILGKVVNVVLAVAGVLWIWKAWTARPPADSRS
jgi:hypothetical protein